MSKVPYQGKRRLDTGVAPLTVMMVIALFNSSSSINILAQERGHYADLIYSNELLSRATNHIPDAIPTPVLEKYGI